MGLVRLLVVLLGLLACPTPDSTQPRPRQRLRLPKTLNPVQDDNLHSICDASSVSNPSQHSGGIEHSHKQQGGLSVCELRLSVQQSHVPGQVWENSGQLQDRRQHWSHLVLCGLKVAVLGQAAQCQVQPIRARLELPSLLYASSTQRSVLRIWLLLQLPARGDLQG